MNQCIYRSAVSGLLSLKFPGYIWHLILQVTYAVQLICGCD